MKVVFWSNIYTRHQESLSGAFAGMAEEYTFIAETEEKQSLELLGKTARKEPAFVHHATSGNRKKLIRWVTENADVVILGVPAPDLVYACLLKRILIFRYSERPFKDDMSAVKRVIRALRWRTWNPPGASIYLLCAGAYTAGDYLKIGMFRNRTFKWGYFSEFKRRQNIEKLLNEKNYSQILWAGRLLDWKHPEAALYLAKELSEKSIRFHLKLIGSGPMRPELEKLRKTLNIEQYVEMPETVSPERLRETMEQSGIFLMTSDRREGWGAVVNEAMSCGCTVIGSSQAGSVPFLIKSGTNGCLYRYGDQAEFFKTAESLLQNPRRQREMGEAACRTIETEWNAEEAAGRFMKLAESILTGRSPDEYESGPCSRASLISEDQNLHDSEGNEKKDRPVPD